MNPYTATTEKPAAPEHPWTDKATGEVSAKIAGPHVLALLLSLGVSAKSAAGCAYQVCIDLEEQGFI